MARIIGNEGSVACSTQNITANAWSMSLSRVVNDVTAFTDASSTFRGGIPTYTGSLSGFMATDSDPQIGSGEFAIADTEATITLTAQTGNTWSGQAVISGASVGTSKTGDATISLDFTFTGTVTETWS
jgi:hypothetical protein